MYASYILMDSFKLQNKIHCTLNMYYGFKLCGFIVVLTVMTSFIMFIKINYQNTVDALALLNT